MVFGFLMVFVIQFLGRFLFFDTLYLENIHQTNIDSIEIVAERVNDGEDLYFVLFDEGLSNVNAYITDEEFDVIDYEDIAEIDEEYYDEYYDEYYTDLLGSEFLFKGEVYYQVFEDFGSNMMTSIYYIGLEDSSVLIFEYNLYGLVNANTVLNQIDLYIIFALIVFLIPYTYWYSKRFSKPLQEMNEQVNALANLEFLEPLEVRSTDEVGQLTESINKVSLSLEEAIGKLRNDIEYEQYKDKKRRELIASLSHELKTPITTLRAVIEGMKDNVGKYSNHDLYLKESLEYLLYMETLSKDLIDAINFESKTIDAEECSLKGMFDRSCRFTNKLIEDKEQVLIEELEDLTVYANREMIVRVFINLVTNASKYSMNGEKIIVSSQTKNNVCKVSVLNTGAHIEEDNLVHLFDPFYRVEKSRNKDTGGSGLGLFIIKTILDGHGSTYNIKNTSEGVLFTFDLKVTQL